MKNHREVDIKLSFSRLKNFCEKEQFKGWDPYDGLNSEVFRHLIFLNKNPLVRLAWIQIFKKNPVNLRKLFLIKKGYNPKGLGLFLNGYCNLYNIKADAVYLEKIEWLAKKILDLVTPGFSGSCWGYNFNWQSRAFFQPKYTPTVVASAFIGYALLDAYDVTGNELFKDHAISVCDFILKDLNRTYDKDGDFSFSYSPYDQTQVYNATLLGSRMLSRAYHYVKNPVYLQEARRSVSFCCKAQNNDGSWPYSPLPFHQWIDNFHTGYNLECIAEYQKYSFDHSFKSNLEAGIQYYLNTFFTNSGIPKYYSDTVYPVDIHAAAQLVITLHRLGLTYKYEDTIRNVLSWTINHMQSSKGFFFFQKHKLYTIKIPYMRWSQAWMFYALSTYMLSERQK